MMMKGCFGEVGVCVVLLVCCWGQEVTAQPALTYHNHVHVAGSTHAESRYGMNDVSCPYVRSFEIDYEHSQFLKDGQPYRYVSGSIHYFRVLAADWPDRLWKLRMAGFNAVQTVIEWATHEPRQGEYLFSGNNDLEEFIKTAQRLGLDVILRIGPYICAERDMGGMPYWLLKLHPDIRLRTSDPAFLRHMDRWLGEVLLPRIRSLLYENGGPVIMVQLENEYGCLVKLCDRHYTKHLRDLTREKLGPRVVLFTTDNPIPDHLMEGKIPGVYATIDFGVGKDPKEMFKMQRLFEPRGPLDNSEYHSGWMDHWGLHHHTVDSKVLAEGLDAILALNASVNMFMFHGGTSFGLTSGSNILPKFRANPTSYDYDAPVSEAGDPTDKYLPIRDVVSKYLPVPQGPIPRPTKKGVYGAVNLTAIASLWEVAARLPTTYHPWPLTFEQLDLSVGLVIYSTRVPFRIPDPARLSLPNVHDRGYVFVGGRDAGMVSREQGMMDVAVRATQGDTITVVVESQGRISAGSHINDFKGLTTNATLNGHVLKGWNMTAVPLTNTSILPDAPWSPRHLPATPGTPSGGLTFYSGVFTVPDEDPHPLNTFLRVNGWSKGVAWVNRFCLGRYWPEVGPQVTLYVPWSILKRGQNELLLLELESAPCPAPLPCAATLQDKHVLDGPTPT
ncbi:beta-galactosidase-like isoform X3 [Portunus trituberculatus]|uniref:beta-galactosidase-like isoform X3 n=1 Tax=Portunus trituberculatus TaxID=210409 RepID=UPI001E1CD242|nr:beta-galactosidase-like isoform X3 [Portunus trituberculatus]